MQRWGKRVRSGEAFFVGSRREASRGSAYMHFRNRRSAEGRWCNRGRGSGLRWDILATAGASDAIMFRVPGVLIPGVQNNTLDKVHKTQLLRDSLHGASRAKKETRPQ